MKKILLAVMLLTGLSASFFEENKKACDDGEARGCSNLGFMYLKGQIVKQNYTKAKELFKKACDGDDTSGCSMLGAIYEQGIGVKQDYLKAVELYGKSCTNGEVIGC